MFFVVSKENPDNQKIFLAHSPPDFPELGEAIPGAIPGDGVFSTPPMQNQKNGKKKQFPECLPDFARNPGRLSHVIPAGFLPVIPAAAIEWLAIIPVAGGRNPCGNNSRPFDLWICTRAKFKLSWFRNH